MRKRIQQVISLIYLCINLAFSNYVLTGFDNSKFLQLNESYISYGCEKLHYESTSLSNVSQFMDQDESKCLFELEIRDLLSEDIRSSRDNVSENGIKQPLEIVSLRIHKQGDDNDSNILNFLNLTSASSLYILDLSNNNIADFSKYETTLSKFRNLKYLNISNCNLTDIRFSTFTNNKMLERLDVSYNNLGQLNMSTDLLNQLQCLSARHCGLTSLNWDAEENASLPLAMLKNVDLSSNALEFLPHFFVSALNESDATVDLRDNNWKPELCSFYPLWRFLSINKNIELGIGKLSLSHPDMRTCSWESCPYPCRCYEDTKIVDCRNKGLTTMPAIGPSEAMILLLQDNLIAKDFNKWPLKDSWSSLTELHLDRNNLVNLSTFSSSYDDSRSVDDSASSNTILPNLNYVSLAENRIESLFKEDWTFLRNVRRINLSHNKLAALNLSYGINDQSKIEELELSHNRFSDFHINNSRMFCDIKYLNLSSNILKDFSVELSSFSSHLEILDLSQNELEAIVYPKDCGVGHRHYGELFPRMQKLYLHNNNFDEMIPALWRGLTDLTIHNNPFNCHFTNIEIMKDFIWNNLEGQIAKQFKPLCHQDEIAKNALRGIRVNYCEKENQNLFILIGCTVLFLSILIFLWAPINNMATYCWKYYIIRKTYHVQLEERKNDVFIISDKNISSTIESEIISRLESLNYQVASPDLYTIGEFQSFNFIQTLGKSRKLIVILNNEITENSSLTWEVKQGFAEEQDYKGFKICALLMGDQIDPRNCPKEIFALVRNRHPIHYNDINFLDKIRRFLGTPINDFTEEAEMVNNFEEGPHEIERRAIDPIIEVHHPPQADWDVSS